MTSPKVDRTGHQIGNWTLLEYRGASTYLMRCVCGTEKVKEYRHTKSGSCGCIKNFHQKPGTQDLTGQSFNYWNVIEYHSVSKYLCECICGNRSIVARFQLINGISKSCGCMRHLQIAESTENRLGRNQVETARLQVIEEYKKRARDTGREFDLSDQDLDELFSGNCFYCQRPPSNRKKTANKQDGFVYSGIDRTNNDKGYTKENTVSCCVTCNTSKRAMSKEVFLDHCRKVVYYQDSKKFDLLSLIKDPSLVQELAYGT